MLDRLMEREPTDDAVAHYRYILIACRDRPPGGCMRSHSMRIGAIKNQPRVFVGG